MRRWLAGIGLVAIVGLGLTGCGVVGGGSAGDDAGVEVSAGMGAEGQALVAMGFDPDEITPAELADLKLVAPSASPSAAPKEKDRDRGKRLKARVLLRKNTLHGEAVVKTKDGSTQTVLVQRGQVTAVDADSITVKSTDGFTITWSFADDLRVVERRNSIQADQLAAGDQVGVAGTKDGDGGAARLIVIPREK
ncbi:hypothetical protein SAMN05421812_106314 [Asanoa hainanensis]|uniref:DUF5666 domain-containing protein n=1 Tax=Asanoa hainanensis TaxID=560556 RepID=A0A239MTF7_9ACTN|nr:hypothetical protein [Asanoa hainanensis]SNT45955.1 hypothetical protein SAMN05421812_106314 [Asanoa hainanensis]